MGFETDIVERASFGVSDTLSGVFDFGVFQPKVTSDFAQKWALTDAVENSLPVSQEKPLLVDRAKPKDVKQLRPEGVGTVLQVLEGRVVSVSYEEQTMEAHLTPKIGQVEDHVAEIDLGWVNQQDKDLIQPGAVFYITVSKIITKAGNVQSLNELRFRRRPVWSRRQVETIKAEAESFWNSFNSI